jgi:ubiquinone biosynthesis protein Coq4
MRRELLALGLKSPLRLIRGLRNLVITVWDPTRSDIRQGINSLIEGALSEVGAERIREFEAQAPEIAALYAAGYDPRLDLPALEALPDGTLGREYARFVRDNGIEPLGDQLEGRPPRNVVAYGLRRAYKLHDVLHVALGCDASVLGEVRIVSYSLGQARHGEGRAPKLALAVLFLNLAVRRPHEFREAILLAHEWLQRGERARAYASVRFEELMERPVAEVRALVMAPA